MNEERRFDNILLAIFGIAVSIFITILLLTHQYKSQDINRDRKVDAKDLLELRKYLLEEDYDINKDGIVDIRDLSKLQKYIINH